MNLVAKETQIVKEVLENDFSKIDAGGADLHKILKSADNNRVLYQFSLNLKDHLTQSSRNHPWIAGLDVVLKNCRREMDLLKKTLIFINDFFARSRKEFMVIKTFRSMPFVTLDVDTLVKGEDFEEVKGILGKYDHEEFGSNPTLQPHMKMKDTLIIDLHHELTWKREDFFDNDLTWKDPREVLIEGIPVFVPNLEVEVMLLISHLFRERWQITLLELLYLKSVSPSVNWDLILAQAAKYGWLYLFKRVASLINSINRKLYKDSCDVIPVTNANYRIFMPLSLPYVFTPHLAMETFFAWKKKVTFYEFAYYCYCLLAYNFTRGDKVPIYRHFEYFDNSNL